MAVVIVLVMTYLIYSPTEGYLSLPYSQIPCWIGFDAHAYTIDAESPAKALAIAERMMTGRLWPNDATAIPLTVADTLEPHCFPTGRR